MIDTATTTPRVLTLNISSSSSSSESISPKIKAGIIIEDRYYCEFEVDTDASSNVITPWMFDKICSGTENKPKKGPPIVILTADGTRTKRPCFETFLSIAKADSPQKAKTFHTAVLEGRSIILGLPAIQYVWPHIYSNLRMQQKAHSEWQNC